MEEAAAVEKCLRSPRGLLGLVNVEIEEEFEELVEALTIQAAIQED